MRFNLERLEPSTRDSRLRQLARYNTIRRHPNRVSDYRCIYVAATGCNDVGECSFVLPPPLSPTPAGRMKAEKVPRSTSESFRNARDGQMD